MGRYYEGDINGKLYHFQNTDDAIRFGGRVIEPQFIQHEFDKTDLEGVLREIREIESFLVKDDSLTPEDKLRIREAIIEEDTCAAADMIDSVIVDAKENPLKPTLASLRLGIEIRDCIIENGKCHFNAYYV